MSSRDETFAQALADGKTAAEAYKIAGFLGNPNNARRKKSYPAIKQRVAEILAQREQAIIAATGQMAAEIVIERQTVIRNIVRIAEKAEADGDWSAALRANVELGRDIGMFVERTVSLNLNADIDRVPDADLWHILEGEGVLRALEAPEDSSRFN